MPAEFKFFPPVLAVCLLTSCGAPQGSNSTAAPSSGHSSSQSSSQSAGQSTDIGTTKTGDESAAGGELNGIFPDAHEHRTKNDVLKKYVPTGRDSKAAALDFVLAAEKAHKMCDFEGAVILADEAIKLEPQNAWAYFEKGRGLLYGSSLDNSQALACLEKAAALKYPQAGAYQLMGSIYDGQKQTRKAVECLDKAVAIEPKNVDVYKDRAALLVSLGEKERACRDYDKWISIDPDNRTPLLMRGELLESMHKYDAALADYNEVGQVRSALGRMSSAKVSLACKLQARLLSRLGRYQEAVKVLSGGVKGGEDLDEILKLRGDAYTALKQYDLAIKDYTDSIESAPGFCRDALEARSKVYALTGKDKLAAEDKSQALKLQEKPAEKVMFRMHEDEAKP